MTVVFWLVAALFLAGALVLLLAPLLAPAATAPSAADLNLAMHREQWREAEAERAAGRLAPALADAMRLDLERRVLDEAPAGEPRLQAAPARRTAIVLALAIPLASLGGYALLGDPRALQAGEPTARTAAPTNGTMTAEQIEQRVAALAERLKAQPADAPGWAMLARSYTALGRYRDAALAYRRAADLAPNQPTLLADFADVLAMAQGKRLAGEPARLVQQALDADPRHAKALALAGSAAFEARDYAAARGFWERLLQVIDPAAPMVRSVQGSIAEARRLEAAATP